MRSELGRLSVMAWLATIGLGVSATAAATPNSRLMILMCTANGPKTVDAPGQPKNRDDNSGSRACHAACLRKRWHGLEAEDDFPA